MEQWLLSKGAVPIFEEMKMRNQNDSGQVIENHL
jgi:hypothetical protein